MTKTEEQRLQDFLYILIRDDLPSGKVANIIRNHSSEKDSVFTNPMLESMAKVYAKAILSGKPIKYKEDI